MLAKKINLNDEPNLREKIIFLAALVVILVIFLETMWQPTSAKNRVMKYDLAGQMQQIDATRKLIDATRSQLDTIASEPEVPSNADPYVKKILERRVVDFTEELNSTADMIANRKIAGKAKIIKVEIGARKDEKNFSSIPITVEMEGKYTAIRDYLRTIENLGRPLLIRSFAMRAEGEKETILKVTLDTVLLIPKI